MQKFYRVRDKDTGYEFTEGFYNPAIHDLVDEPATDAGGVPLPSKPHIEPGDATDADGQLLRGQSLDDALDAAGLPKSGTVAEKQLRLAEHNADTEV